MYDSGSEPVTSTLWSTSPILKLIFLSLSLSLSAGLKLHPLSHCVISSSLDGTMRMWSLESMIEVCGGQGALLRRNGVDTVEVR